MSRVAGFVGRFNYNYADKYYAEVSFRHDGSYLFGGMNKRWVTLPGVSLAWRINNEDWFDASWINNLKLEPVSVKQLLVVSVLPVEKHDGNFQNAVIIGGEKSIYVVCCYIGQILICHGRNV
ncbi:hypothetical protein [Bacteroides faecis]|uniref:hypothetical protein n=1 Tax=Bacteroides faecis TaxID=674529 RepID=UPI002165E860|nr:hypothetical protein [Bacteroides faecis]MCS2578116.1 hypothetical protein [Bacteroides faecis]